MSTLTQFYEPWVEPALMRVLEDNLSLAYARALSERRAAVWLLLAVWLALDDYHFVWRIMIEAALVWMLTRGNHFTCTPYCR